MNINESDITRFLHSRVALVFFAIIAFITTNIAFSNGNITPILDNKSLGLTPINQWVEPGRSSMIVNMLLNFGIAALMIYLNKAFNILRSPTIIFAGLFLILQIPISIITGQLYGGTVICAIILICACYLFSTYNSPNPWAIFTIFSILSFGTFFQYAFMFFAPIMLVGCVQMRILDLRIALAAILGIATPPWILFGFGIISPEEFSFPKFSGIYEQLSSAEIIHILVSIAISVITCIGAWIVNLVKIISYNAQTRAYNGFFAMLSLLSVFLMLIDFTNFIIYVPLLNCCTALQLGHLFTIYESRRSYIGIIAVFAVYLGLYLWGAWI